MSSMVSPQYLVDEDVEMEAAAAAPAQSRARVTAVAIRHPLESSNAASASGGQPPPERRPERRDRQTSGSPDGSPKVRVVESSQDAAIMEKFTAMQAALQVLTDAVKDGQAAAKASTKASEATTQKLSEYRVMLDGALRRLDRVERTSRVPSDDQISIGSPQPIIREEKGKGREVSPRLSPASTHEDDDVSDDPQRSNSDSDEDEAPRAVKQDPWRTRYTKNREASRRAEMSKAYHAFQKTFAEDDDESFLPPPKKFMPTKGGAGPSIRLTGFDTGTSRTSGSAPQTTGEPPGLRDGVGLEDLEGLSKHFPANSTERFMGLAFATLGRSLDKFASVVDHGVGSQPAPRGVRRSKLFPASPQRTADSERTFMLGQVRRHMNLLLHISCDEDITTSAAASTDIEEQVSAFEEDEAQAIPEPTLYPFLPSWSNPRGPWNLTLAHQFQVYMIKQIGLPRHLTEDIREAFLARLERLRRLIKASQPKPGESTAQRDDRRKREKEATEHRARVNGRRFHLNVKRLEISHERRDVPSNAKAWASIAACIEKLTADGMSSDDSDGGGTRTVRKTPWRSKKITKLLQVVDGDAKSSGGHINTRRVRRSTAPHSRRTAPPGLPANFYNDDWFALLKDHEQWELRRSKAFPIPEFERD